MVQRQEQPWWAVIVLLAVFVPLGVIVLTLKALRETWARRKNGRMLCILGAISVCMGALGGALAVLSGADNPQIAAAIFGLPAAVLALFGVAILVWGALLLHKAGQMERVKDVLRVSAQRDIAELAMSVGLPVPRMARLLQQMVEEGHIRGAYVDWGQMRLMTRENAAQTALTCSHCGGTTVLKAGMPPVCAYCGAKL